MQYRGYVLDYGEGGNFWEYSIFDPYGVKVANGFEMRKVFDEAGLVARLKAKVDERLKPLAHVSPMSGRPEFQNSPPKKKSVKPRVEDVVTEFFA
jgi:hypothetical protein